MKKVYKYPTVHCVKGYARSVIQDLSKYTYYFAPNTLAEVLKSLEGKTINECLIKHPIAHHETIKEYVDFLVDNQFVYLSEQHISFDHSSSVFDYPAVISNAIIVLEDIDIAKLQKWIFDLEILGCENIQIYCKKKLLLQDVSGILSVFENTRILNLEILLNFTDYLLDKNTVNLLFDQQTRLFKIVVYNSPDSNINFIDVFKQKSIIYNKATINYLDCGFVHPVAFRKNADFFNESKTYNNCLNKKLCIDFDGNIKNCPAMQQSFGNIKDTSLQDAIKKNGFKNLWCIHKDQIEVCKDCEFRYMCTDCRCFIKTPENIYSQPAKCTYNPYICKWEGQGGYIPVEKCGIYSNKTGFIPDEAKIAEFNTQIWAENDA
ncbi:grasp-with-spasm system SPASM domain peptide maturase [Bacteroidales bacterium OttesenSCG-928-B11]|nr:grasp-with-spasm system SPASM domain peptide maturase [Bacteroidales bacterium OttesenSCG-928-B11]MDL2326465.1 grasp-with-spasm system SPASM domain peptide maturase [Bacteroidales bacterium OttesenSCG-928-A14]